MDRQDTLLVALKAMLEPWDGFTVAELNRRHRFGLLDEPQLIRILAARCAVAAAEAE
jgi:hypothetical protein